MGMTKYIYKKMDNSNIIFYSHCLRVISKVNIQKSIKRTKIYMHINKK